jgi:predicted dehydrogenase
MIFQDQSTHSPASIVAIGAGNRMRTYMHYVLEHPEEVTLVAVVEPNELRRNAMADLFHVPQENRFSDYTDFFNNPVPADAVVICTPENAHFKPSMLAIQHGYHILLEKPIAQTLEECLQIADAAKKAHVLVGICHVMRYHPCFLKIKELIDSGELGKIISINHTEGVGIDRDTHSYVRGIMNREKENNPMLLAKCCHDVDFLLWLTGSNCKKLSSFGSLRWFTKENAPQGSALRCIDCKVEKTCPFSAVDLYWRRREWIRNFDIPKGKTIEDAIQMELKGGPHGRCVYHCDNDVVDNQVLLMEMDDKTTIFMSMDIFTQFEYRTTKIQLTKGEITSNENKVSVNIFRNHHQQIFDFTEVMKQPYHAGADLKIFEDFIHAIGKDHRPFPTPIEDSIESHRICFEGERSRLTGQTISFQHDS